jgi:hypothetical protein
MNTAALLKMLADDDDDGDFSSDLLPEAQIARLTEVAARIAAGNPFKVGDLVTVRDDAPIKGAGKPHLVIEFIPDAQLGLGTLGNWAFAARHDVVVLSVSGDDITPHVLPHWCLQHFAA